MASRLSRTRAPLFQSVVGVVEDVRYRGVLCPDVDLYVPYRQSKPQPNKLVPRTMIPPEALAPLLRRELAELLYRVDPSDVPTFSGVADAPRDQSSCEPRPRATDLTR